MRVAAYQAAATRDVDRAISQLRRQLAEAQAAGVDLLCFPECHIGGYFPNDRAATEAAAYELHTPPFRQLVNRIGASGTTLVVGIAERMGARLFNTAIVLRDGRLIGCYRKARPNEAFFSPGTEVPTFRAAGERFGINICNDANYPEVAQATADAGVRGIVMPLNNYLRHAVAETWRERHLANLVARARETGCWVVSADIVGTCRERIAYGCTAIVDATGGVLARVPEGTTGLVSADLG